MDFIFDNLIFLIAAAAGLVQWWKSTQEAKAERRVEEERKRAMLEEMAKHGGGAAMQKERGAEVPPPLPGTGTPGRSAPVPPPYPGRHQEARVPERLVIIGAEAPGADLNLNPELERQEALARKLSEMKRVRRAGPPAGVTWGKPAVAGDAGAVASGGVGGRLRNRAELRRAIVMKEILERPVSLR